MKKITILLLLCSIVLLSYAQDASKIQHAKTFEMFHKIHDFGPSYEGRIIKAVRIGEHFWLAESLDSPHRTLGSGGNWTEILEDEKAIEFSVIERYFTDNNLDKSMLNQFKNGVFESVFGRHYNQYSVYGNWAPHSQYRCPISRAMIFTDPNNHSIVYSSGGWGDDNLYTWLTPRLNDIQQLFAMTAFSEHNTTGILTGKDVRIDLAAKKDDNPLAKDIKLANSETYFSDWHSTATGRYNFNLMPAGQTLEKGTQLKNLFKDITFALNIDTKAILLRLGDEISYEKADIANAPEIPFAQPQVTPFTWIPAAEKWSTVRMRRTLNPTELGYELYYNKAKKDIIKKDVDENGSIVGNVPVGYEILEHGYLRGFYAQYFIYETHRNPGYSIEDIIRFAKCVKDPLLPKPDCDCSAVYLTGHMKIVGNGGEEYSHNILGSENFIVDAPSTDPQRVKIGFFSANGTLVKRLDKGVNRDNMTYDCSVENYNANLVATIQAYIEEYNPYGNNKIITIGKLLEHEASSHLVDHLNVRYYKPGVTPTLAAFGMLAPEPFSISAQSGHLVGNFDPEKPNSLKSYVHSAMQGEENIILIRLPLKAGVSIDDYTIAMYNAEGDFICEAAYSVKQVGSAAMFECYIPYEDHQGEYLEGGFDGVFAPVFKSTINQDNPTKISKTSHVKSKVDRVPVHVEEDWGWGFSAMSATAEPIEKLTLNFSPNPVVDAFQVSGNFEKVLEINVYSLVGGLLKTVKNSDSVNITTLASGVYKVGVTTEKGYVAGTIIKK